MMMGIISASLHKLGTRSNTNISVVGTRKEIIVDKMHMARHAVQDIQEELEASREDVATLHYFAIGHEYWESQLINITTSIQ